MSKLTELLAKRDKLKAEIENSPNNQLAALEAEIAQAQERERLAKEEAKNAQAQEQSKAGRDAYLVAARRLVDLGEALDNLRALPFAPSIIPQRLFTLVDESLAILRQVDPGAIGLPPKPTPEQEAQITRRNAKERKARMIAIYTEEAKRLHGEPKRDAERQLAKWQNVKIE